MFAYCYNNPVNLSDPSGNAPSDQRGPPEFPPKPWAQDAVLRIAREAAAAKEATQKVNPPPAKTTTVKPKQGTKKEAKVVAQVIYHESGGTLQDVINVGAVMYNMAGEKRISIIDLALSSEFEGNKQNFSEIDYNSPKWNRSILIAEELVGVVPWDNMNNSIVGNANQFRSQTTWTDQSYCDEDGNYYFRYAGNEFYTPVTYIYGIGVEFSNVYFWYDKRKYG